MGVIINENSDLGKEIKRWNTPRNQFVVIDGETTDVKGMGAVGYEPYPRMVYKAQRTPGGQFKCLLPPPHPHEHMTIQSLEFATLMVETFNKTCWLIVKTEEEYKREYANGWRDNALEAELHHEQIEKDIAQAAGEAEYAAKRMREQARAEFEAAGAATEHHVTDVTAKRIITGHGEVEKGGKREKETSR